MEKRKLGETTLELSRIGLGTWAIGGGGWKFGWGPQDDRQSLATIERAMELGINWIDTAPLYGLGHAEETVGRAIRNLREKPFIATKFGILWDGKRSMNHSLKKQSVKRELEASLKRLKVEAVDLYQMHWPVPEEDIEEAWDGARELVKEGKARFIGVSNASVAQLEKLKSICKPASAQLPYSIINRGIEKEIMPYCRKENIGILVYGVLEKGLLTGEFSKEKIDKLPMDDHRKRDPAFLEPELSVNLEAAGNLKAEALKTGLNPAELAIAGVLMNESVSAAIVGARSPEQVEENVESV
jgi:aryl-alcohol dehydrogenase-like predicted oxidoreductase